MQYALLALIFFAAVFEFVATGRLTLGGAALVFVFLRLQAERSANHFVKYGKDGPPPPPWQSAEAFVEPEPEAPWVTDDNPFPRAEEEVEVAPLRGKRKQKSYYGPRPESAGAPPPPAPEGARVLPFPTSTQGARFDPEDRTDRITRPAPAKPAAPKPVPPSEFKEPRFHGAPHEVLGIAREAGTKVILKAFRHWIKQHHPDHAGSASAGDRARRLHEAKNALLKARKGRDSASA